MKEQLGTHFRKRRIWLKYTQERVAKECNISVRWYRKIEKNEHFPGTTTLHAICRTLGIEKETMRQLYIQSLKSESRLFRIADMYFRSGDQQNARKVISRYFAVIRQKKRNKKKLRLNNYVPILTCTPVYYVDIEKIFLSL